MKHPGLEMSFLVVAIAAAASVPAPSPALADTAVGGPPPEIRSGLARFNAVSKDGRRVVFTSRLRLARGDRDRLLDLYAREGARTTLLSAGSDASGPGAAVQFAGATPDARTVVFRTAEQLTGEDADALPDLYRRGPSGLDLVSLAGPHPDASWPKFDAVLPDGRTVLFSSDSRLAEGDGDDRRDVYEYRAGRTRLVSIGTPAAVRFLAAAPDGTPVFFSVPSASGGDRTDIYESRDGGTEFVATGSFAAAATSGSRVFFETDAALAPSDTDLKRDVYMRGYGRIDHVSTGPGDTGTFDARLAAIGPAGRRAFFVTGESFGPLAGDVYCALFERRARQTSVVSVGKRGPLSVGCGPPRIFVSKDGDRVVFKGEGEILMRERGVTKRVSGSSRAPLGRFGVFPLHGAAAQVGRVAFLTVRRLDRRDRDNAHDIYAYGPKGIRVVSVGPVGGNASPSDPPGALIYDVPTFGGATDDGRFVYFTSAERLIRGDRDQKIDLYERGPSGLRLVSVRSGRSAR